MKSKPSILSAILLLSILTVFSAAASGASPDLVITDIWSEGSVIWYQVRNIGDEKTTASFDNVLFVDGYFAMSDSVQETVYPGDRVTRFFDKYDWVCGQESDTLEVEADAGGDILESEENNNIRQEKWVCDTTAPVITEGPAVDPKRYSARITWKTDKLCDSVVKYDTKAGYYGQELSDSSDVTDHEIILENLTASTTYHFIVESTDTSENTVAVKDMFFTTQSAADDKDPNVFFMAAASSSFPLEMAAEVTDMVGVERVEFFIDGKHVGTDYSPPYRMLMNPYYLQMTLEDMTDMHVIQAEAYDFSDNTGMMAATWVWDDECMSVPAELEIWYPRYEHIVYTTGDTDPAEDVEILMHALEGTTIADLMPEGMPRTPRGEVFEGELGWVTMTGIEFELDGEPVELTYLGEHMWLEDITSYMLDVEGLNLGSHTLLARKVLDNGCVKSDTAQIVVERHRPDISINRTVSWWYSNQFMVELQITNEGLTPVTLDRISDTMVGFQGYLNNTPTYEYADCGYLPEEKECRIEIDFTADTANTLAPGEMTWVYYSAIPIMYNDDLFADYQFGGEGWIEYHDDYESFHDDNHIVTMWDYSGISIYTAVNGAFGTADYLLVTNPHQLYKLYNDFEVDELLASCAKLAYFRQGVLGYFHSYSTILTEYEGDRRADVGNIFGANDLVSDIKDEVYLLDRHPGEDDDAVRAYDFASEFKPRSGEIPILLGDDYLQAGDGILLGDVIPTDGVWPHPEEEIMLINGHADTEAEGLGDVTIYKYLPGSAAFTTDTFHIPSYELGQGLATGDVLYSEYFDGEEIIVARDGGRIDMYGELNASYNMWISDTCYAYGDWFVVGDVLGTAYDDIIIGDLSEGQIVVYDKDNGFSGADMTFSITLGANDDIAVGDVIGNWKEDIVVADASAQTIYIYDFNNDPASSPTVVELPIRIELDDQLMVADMIDGVKSEVLIARGTNRPYLKGYLEICHIPDGQSYDDRFGFDELIHEHGGWANKLAPSWCSNGYLLIVGETPIIPVFGAAYNGLDMDWRAPFTDMYYADTTGNPDEPELSVGRIPGNDAARLRQVVDRCTEMAQGYFMLDNSSAYLVRGHECCPPAWGIPDCACLDFVGGNNNIDALLTAKGFTTLQESTEGASAINEATLFSHAQDRDIIFLGAHGGWNVWDIVEEWEVTGIGGFTPGTTRPFVHAMSCSTASYPIGQSFAESFLQAGASAYIGVTSRADFGGSQPLYELFYEQLDSYIPIAKVLRDAKCDLIRSAAGSGSYTEIGYNCAANHYFGDPKMTFSGYWPDALPRSKTQNTIALDETRTTSAIQINIPNFEVSVIAGKDYTRIPGEGVVIEEGMPMVPVYTETYTLDEGYQVQDVILTEKGQMSETSGLDLPVYERLELGSSATTERTSPAGEGFWPEKEFDWYVTSAPGGGTILVLNIYPFYYNSTTTQVKFYQSYNFDLIYEPSSIEINRLMTDKVIYDVGEDIEIEMYLYNGSGQGVDVLLETVIKLNNGQTVDGLPLRILKQMNGLASYSMHWQCPAAEDYTIEVTAKGNDGTVFDRESCRIKAGVEAGEIQSLNVQPECFNAGDTVGISAAFVNTGSTVLSGRIIAEVQDLDGFKVEEFSEEFTELAPNASADLNAVWENAMYPRGECRIVVYAQYEGLTTAMSVFPEIVASPAGDFDGDEIISIADFAYMAACWLDNTAGADIAPWGGDCIVDTLDLEVVIGGWLEATTP